MSLQPDELPLNHKIVIEKCGISQLEDGLCHVCSKELGTGSAIRVDDSQNRDIEYAPECPVWHCLGCWEPTSPLITQLFQHTHDFHQSLSKFSIRMNITVSGWSVLECKDRLNVINRIFE